MDLVPLSQEVWILDGSGQNLPCVGTVLSSYLILTVASCLYGKAQNQNGLSVRTKGRNSKVDRLIFHPDFLNSTLENDLAILVLDKNLNFQTAPTFNIWNSALTKSPFMNFSGRLCRGDSEFSPLKMEISEPIQCSHFASQGDKLCLLPTIFKGSGTNSTRKDCSMPPAGSSLICEDEKHGEFLCGILAASLENTGEKEEKRQIYTNLTQHLKWVQATFRKIKTKTRAKAQVKRRADELSKRNKVKRDVESISETKSEADDVDYSVEEQVPESTSSKPIIPYYQSPVYAVLAGVAVPKSDPLPYQLSLRYWRGGEWEHYCGGVILDETTAITAAHCFVDSTDASQYRVVAGDNNLDQDDKEEQTLSVREITIHPEFTNYLKGNDIAILHLGKPVTGSGSGFKFNKFVQGVWLSDLSAADLASTRAVISGWGQTSNAPKSSDILQRGSVSILPPQDCDWRLTGLKASGPGIMCALNPETRTCKGDSGGPLVIPNYKVDGTTRNLLVGIVSFGAKGCEMKNRAVFLTEISHFLGWIEQNRVLQPTTTVARPTPRPTPRPVPVSTPRPVTEPPVRASSRPTPPRPTTRTGSGSTSFSRSCSNGVCTESRGNGQAASSFASSSCVGSVCTGSGSTLNSDGTFTSFGF